MNKKSENLKGILIRVKNVADQVLYRPDLRTPEWGIEQIKGILAEVKNGNEQAEVKELWEKYHATYQDTKKNGRRAEEQASAEICRVIEYILS